MHHHFISYSGLLSGVTGVLLPYLLVVLPFSLMIQKLTHWGILSEKYPLHSDFKGKWLNWQETGPGIGRILFLSIGLNPEYLFLKFSPKFLFPLTESIQIPWSKIQLVKEQKIFWKTYCVFGIDGVPDLMIRRSKELNDYLASNTDHAKICFNLNEW
jgi:hypothetical protein